MEQRFWRGKGSWKQQILEENLDITLVLYQIPLISVIYSPTFSHAVVIYHYR